METYINIKQLYLCRICLNPFYMIYKVPEEGPVLININKKSIQELGQRHEPDDSQFHVSTVTDMDEFQQAEKAQ